MRNAVPFYLSSALVHTTCQTLVKELSLQPSVSGLTRSQKVFSAGNLGREKRITSPEDSTISARIRLSVDMGLRGKTNTG